MEDEFDDLKSWVLVWSNCTIIILRAVKGWIRKGNGGRKLGEKNS